jgi:hypothetical protein
MQGAHTRRSHERGEAAPHAAIAWARLMLIASALDAHPSGVTEAASQAAFDEAVAAAHASALDAHAKRSAAASQAAIPWARPMLAAHVLDAHMAE